MSNRRDHKRTDINKSAIRQKRRKVDSIDYKLVSLVMFLS